MELPKLEIIRENRPDGCPGQLYVNGLSLAYTLEKPWLPIPETKGGEPNNSCVPTGLYKAVRYKSRKYGRCFILENQDLDVYKAENEMMTTDQRFACLFAHRGTYVRNFKGCIGLGDSFEENSEMMIYNTRTTCRKIMDELYEYGQDLHLKISWKEDHNWTDPLGKAA